MKKPRKSKICRNCGRKYRLCRMQLFCSDLCLRQYEDRLPRPWLTDHRRMMWLGWFNKREIDGTPVADYTGAMARRIIHG